MGPVQPMPTQPQGTNLGPRAGTGEFTMPNYY